MRDGGFAGLFPLFYFTTSNMILAKLYKDCKKSSQDRELVICYVLTQPIEGAVEAT